MFKVMSISHFLLNIKEPYRAQSIHWAPSPSHHIIAYGYNVTLLWTHRLVFACLFSVCGCICHRSESGSILTIVFLQFVPSVMDQLLSPWWRTLTWLLLEMNRSVWIGLCFVYLLNNSWGRHKILGFHISQHVETDRPLPPGIWCCWREICCESNCGFTPHGSFRTAYSWNLDVWINMYLA